MLQHKFILFLYELSISYIQTSFTEKKKKTRGPVTYEPNISLSVVSLSGYYVYIYSQKEVFLAMNSFIVIFDEQFKPEDTVVLL